MKEDIEEKVKEIICNIIENNDFYSQITDQTNLIDDAGMDSIQIMQLVVELETVFNIEFHDDDLIIENLANMQCLNQLIHQRIG